MSAKAVLQEEKPGASWFPVTFNLPAHVVDPDALGVLADSLTGCGAVFYTSKLFGSSAITLDVHQQKTRSPGAVPKITISLYHEG